MEKGSCCDNNGLKKGAWTEDEDNKLRAYIERYGHWNWNLLPKFAGTRDYFWVHIFSHGFENLMSWYLYMFRRV